MNPTLSKALYIILLSLGLAIVFNVLFFGKMIGISAVVFALIFLGALTIFSWYQQLSLRKTWWLLLLIIFFALMPAIRANDFLTFLNVCMTFGLLMLLAHQLAGTPVTVMRLRHYLILAVVVPFRMLRKALYTFSLISQIHSSVQHRDTWLRIVKGVIMATPILIIFGVLFSQADLAFAKFIQQFVHITVSERSLQYSVLLTIAFVAALSFLSYVFFATPPQPETLAHKQLTEAGKGRLIEVLVLLGLIAALFLIFIGFQITYLFGGESNIVHSGFTYAEYARQGFWELLVVAALSLVLLFGAEKYAGVEVNPDKKFLIAALILIAEVVIVIISAFKRLTLYIDAYNLTEPRFYAMGFIILLLVLFLLLIIKFVQSRREQFFAFGALLAITGCMVVLNIINPDALIARSNIEAFSRTGKLDVLYVGSLLSVDAMPQKIELYQKLEGEDREILKGLLENDKDLLGSKLHHWQSANLARHNARQSLRELFK